MVKRALVIVAVTVAGVVHSHSTNTGLGLIALYHLDEGTGSTVGDSSGLSNDGRIVGAASWVKGMKGGGLEFNGLSSVRIASTTALDLKDKISVALWLKGEGSKFREGTEYLNMRSPYFQVCGDTIYFTMNSDQVPPEQALIVAQNASNPNSAHVDFTSWSDIWHLWTGTADIDLSLRKLARRTESPFGALEPKLQVVGDRIYYEYFGQDEKKAWQIWTANSEIDGSQWSTTKQTKHVAGYRVEQDYTIQVVGKKIYYVFPQRDENDEFQEWTASSDLDGSDFKAIKRTTEGGWTGGLQVVGNRVFYIFGTMNQFSKFSANKTRKERIYFASADTDGNNWKIIRTIENVGPVWASFFVANEKLFFMYSQLDSTNLPHLFTGHMNIDGSDFQPVQRTFGEDTAMPDPNGLQIVGSKAYYSFEITRLKEWNIARIANWGTVGHNWWTASSDLDNSSWVAIQRTASPPDVLAPYKSIQIIGGKSYYSLDEIYSVTQQRGRFATSGANIINKGDAYGLGLTENNDARAFINAGQDYLFRADAPSDVTGATADHGIDDSWHHVVMTYDRKQLDLYIDGILAAATPYAMSIGSNPFPLVIGDGFKGVVDEISIYNRVLSPNEIRAQFNSH